MGRKVYRQRVIVGASPHRVTMAEYAVLLRVEADRLGVGGDAQHVVDFWYEHDDIKPQAERTFLVVGTGHEVPPGAVYHGTTARTAEGLVWHLYEVYELDGAKEGEGR